MQEIAGLLTGKQPKPRDTGKVEIAELRVTRTQSRVFGGATLIGLGKPEQDQRKKDADVGSGSLSLAMKAQATSPDCRGGTTHGME